MPFLRVTFVDGCNAADFINQDERRHDVVLAKRLELIYIDPVTGNTPSVNAQINEEVRHFYSYHILVLCL